MIVSNPFVWWIGITILFLVGYWIKRKRTQKVLKKWETQDIAEDLGIHFEDEDS
jgi:membrane protein DedA with SNARE-associated domain